MKPWTNEVLDETYGLDEGQAGLDQLVTECLELLGLQRSRISFEKM